MSFEERNTWIGLVVSLLIGAFFAERVLDGIEAGRFLGQDGLRDWARLVIWIIPAGVAAMVAGTILGHILFAVLNNEPEPDFTSDERDSYINFWALRVTLVMTGTSFFLGLLLLALGWQVFVVLNILLAGYWLGEVIGGLVKLAFYRGLL